MDSVSSWAFGFGFGTYVTVEVATAEEGWLCDDDEREKGAFNWGWVGFFLNPINLNLDYPLLITLLIGLIKFKV